MIKNSRFERTITKIGSRRRKVYGEAYQAGAMSLATTHTLTPDTSKTIVEVEACNFGCERHEVIYCVRFEEVDLL